MASLNADDEANLDEIYAMLDAEQGGGYGASLDDISGSTDSFRGQEQEYTPEELELMQLMRDTEGQRRQVSELNPSVSEFRPGQPVKQPVQPTPAPPAPPATQPSQPPVVTESTGSDETSSIHSTLHHLIYLYKQKHSELDFSFKGRMKLIPELEGKMIEAFPELATAAKQTVGMELRGFIAEELRAWKKNPDWYTPPEESQSVETTPKESNEAPEVEATQKQSYDPACQVRMISNEGLISVTESRIKEHFVESSQRVVDVEVNGDSAVVTFDGKTQPKIFLSRHSNGTLYGIDSFTFKITRV